MHAGIKAGRLTRTIIALGISALFTLPLLSGADHSPAGGSGSPTADLWVGEIKEIIGVHLEDGSRVLSIPSHQLEDIAVDNERDVVWAATKKELIKFDRSGNELLRTALPITVPASDGKRRDTKMSKPGRSLDRKEHDDDQDDAGTASAAGTHISLDPAEGSLWVGSGTWLIKYAPDGRLQLKRAVPSHIVDVTVNIADGTCWAGQKDGAIQYSPDGQVLRTVRLEKGNQLSAVAVDPRDNALWVGSMKGLVRFDQQAQEVFRTDEPRDIQDLKVDQGSGALWLITKQEVHRYSSEGRKLSRIKPCPDEHEYEHHHREHLSKGGNGPDSDGCRSDDHHKDDHRQCEDNLVAIAVDHATGSAFVAWRKTVLMLDSSGSALRWFEGFEQIKALDVGLQKLTVTISAPENGAVVSETLVTVSGSVSDPGARVAVNGREATVTGRAFEAREVPLAIGDNTIAARATTFARLTSTATITVTRRALMPPVSIRISTPQAGEAFTTSRVTVTGTVSDPAAIVVVNGVLATVNGNTFAAPNIPLSIGNNSITASALDTHGQSAADSVTVVMTWLSLSVASPEPGQEVLGATTTVVGTVSDPATHVEVNGKEAVVGGDGSFSAAGVKISEGWNKIIAQAVNRDGQTAMAEVEVHRQKQASAYVDVRILAPHDRAIISSPTFTVFGTVSDPRAEVIVNDVPAQIDGNLFSAQVYACDEPGEPQYEGAGNCLITVSVYTPDGEVVKQYTTYTYDPRIDPLRISITNLPRTSTVTSSTVEVRGTVHNALADVAPTWVQVNDTWAEVTGNTFTASLQLDQGVNYLSARAENIAGEVVVDAVEIIYEYPGTPLWAAVYNPADGAIVNRSEIPVSGYVSDSTAAVTVNGQVAAQDRWAFRLPAVALAEGENYLTTYATRPNGENTTSSVTVIYDPNYPSPPAPQLAALPELIRGRSVLVSGVASPQQGVEIFLNGTAQISGAADAEGLFSLSVGNLQEGPNLITSRCIDRYGNRSAFSNDAVTTVDTIRPFIGNIEVLLRSFNISIVRAAISGGTEPFADIEIVIDGDPDQRYRSTADSGGAFSVDALLTAGRHELHVRAVDRAGNSRSYGKFHTVHVPEVNRPLPPRIDPLPSPVSEAAITVEGIAYARFRVGLYRNGEYLGETTADTRGRFRFGNVNLGPGANILKVRQFEDRVDLGGAYFTLEAVESAEQAVEVVAGTPVRPIVKIDFPRDGSVTTAPRIPLRGTIDGPAAWMTANGSYDSDVTGARNENGRFVSNDALPLLPGPNTLWVSAAAPDGSRGVDKITVYYRPDAAAPAVAITSPASGEVYDRSVNVAGGAGPAQKVIVNEAEAMMDAGAFSAMIDILGFGYASHPGMAGSVITAWAMDEVGAIGHHEVSVGYKYVPVPKISILTPAEGQILDMPTAIVSGTVADATELTVNGRPVLISGGIFSAVVDLPAERNSFTVIAKNGPKASAATVVAYYLPASQVSLQSVALTPDPLSLSLGRGKQVTATGTYSNGRAVDLTSACNWYSSDESVALVRTGYVLSKRWGRAIVTAQCAGFTSEVRVAVNEADVEEVQVAYEMVLADGKTYLALDSPRPNPGDTIAFRALGLYADGNVDDLSALVTWSSSNTAVAAPDAKGSATALALGNATITVTYKDVTGSATMTVVPPRITLVIMSPAVDATTDRERITVKGAVFSKAAEVGVSVNGMPATVSGNLFVVNRVPVPEGDSVINVEASDTNGATASAQMVVRRESSGNPLRLAASIESGIGPLETVIRIDGVPTDAVPDINASGPGAVEFLDCAGTDSCKIRMTAAGVYTVTVTSVAYDGNTYTDSIDIMVLDRAKLDALLQAKWAGMKAALIIGDTERALKYFSADVQNRYRAAFTTLGNKISSIAEEMQPIELIYINDSIAKYKIRRIQVVNGQIVILTYYIYFSLNGDGRWVVEQF